MILSLLNRRSVVFVVGVVCLSAVFSVCETSAQKWAPADGHTLVVIGQNLKDMEEYVRMSDSIPAGFMTYTSIQEADGLDAPAVDRGAGIHFAGHYVQRYPGTILQVGLYMVNALDDILAGRYDDNIAALGRWIKTAQRPVYLRIGYEFDLPDNHYDPESYRAAFRYIVDRLRNDGVDNVAFVWHSYGQIHPARPMMNWYPGDDYVDWFGISFFNPFNQGNMAIIARLSKQHGKPLMLAESTPFQVGVLRGEKSWKIWFSRYFDFIEQWDVKMLCYINSGWDELPMFMGQGWGEARLQRNDFVKQRWMQKMTEERFIHFSPDLFEQIGFQQHHVSP